MMETDNYSRFYMTEEEAEASVPETPENPVLFTSMDDMTNLIRLANDTYKYLKNDFTSLGDGSLHDDMSLDARNALIASIDRHVAELESLAHRIIEQVRLNVTEIKSLQVNTSAIDVNALDDLFEGVSTTALETKDINFRQMHT